VAVTGFSLTPMSGVAYPELVQLAREVEDAGFAGIFVPESNNDVLMCCYAVATATRRVKIGTWIVNIYLREPTLCAAAAEMVQDQSGGRFILGLGVSHRPLLEARGVEMGNGREHLKQYTAIIRATLSGEPVGTSASRFRKPKTPVPIYFAALALETARLGGELADGLMLHFCPPERMRKAIEAGREAAVKRGRKHSDVTMTVGLKTFLHDDLKTAYAMARRDIANYGTLPFYNRLMVRSGFEAEARTITQAAARGDSAAMVAAVSERMADAFALIGPPSRCSERLAQYRENGADIPIIVPVAGTEDYAAYVRRVLKTFAKLN
jgi:alkanesulfonate monooxygenase SsuD/methylene tetrahydromethanopterin reductase-like flavin-dependent oxidoreductase (luciferase family)